MASTKVKISARLKIGLIISSLIFIFTLLEFTARIWLKFFASPEQYKTYVLYADITPNKRQWSPHHYLNYYPTPNYKNGLLQHNSLGYRGQEFSPKKPPGVYRIVVLGGSSAYTEFVNDNKKTFTAWLERLLRNKYGYTNVEVINAGSGGYNSWESLINLEFRVLDIEPDLIIIYQGVNDVHARFVNPNYYRGDNSGRRKQWAIPPAPWWQHSCFLRILARAKGWTHQVGLETAVSAPTVLPAYIKSLEKKYYKHFLLALQSNPPVYFRRNLNNMVAIASENGIAVILSTWAYSPYFDDYASTLHYKVGIQQNNEVIREVAKQQQLPLFEFVQEMPKDKKFWHDGRHVNEKGSFLKGALFADFIDKLDILKK